MNKEIDDNILYDVETLYIEGLSARRIAQILSVDVGLVLDALEYLNVADQPQEENQDFY